MLECHDGAAQWRGAIAIGGLLLALWSASAATKTLMQGVGVAYGARESRGLIVFNLTAYLFTFGLIAGAAVALSELVSLAVDWLRGPLLAGFAILGLAILHPFGPPRWPARWRAITPGKGSGLGTRGPRVAGPQGGPRQPGDA